MLTIGFEVGWATFLHIGLYILYTFKYISIVSRREVGDNRTIPRIVPRLSAIIGKFSTDSSMLNYDTISLLYTASNYPCIHYQLLTEETRVTSYRSKTNNFCDRNLNGWYRFWGAAGDRMLEKCPVIADKTVFPCGAYYHGWLNTKNPKPLDGTVNRTVCFSDVVSCQCRSFFSRQIQMRNCGSYFVYNLQGLNDICNGAFGNNARYCGMRGIFIYHQCNTYKKHWKAISIYKIIITFSTTVIKR